MDNDMAGEVAVVTGASQGIGEAVARRFAAEGVRLALTDLGDEILPVADDIARGCPSSGAFGVVTDVSDPAACDALIQAAASRHGGVDVLAHATAIPQRKAPVAELAPEEWDQVMAVNVKGAFLLCRSVIPLLPKPGGAIVFTGSPTCRPCSRRSPPPSTGGAGSTLPATTPRPD